MAINLDELKKNCPVVAEMAEAKEIAWVNPGLTGYTQSMKQVTLTMADMEEAESRWERFAPFIRTCFPETEVTGGLIESPLREINSMKKLLNDRWNAGITGRLLLKMDSHLAVAGSVKARGGIYEILKHSEDLAIRYGMLTMEDNYAVLAEPEFREFFGRYSIHVGSTGNLGLSIGIISATLGYKVTVHMSMDARKWKKDLLREKGVNVIEYASDYSEAVKHGRKLADADPMSYFVDDENSVNLFLGYSVAAKRLQKQLYEMNIAVDSDHPLFVYIPCGVGGAPGGITFGLKQVFKDNVYCFFEEPTQAPCMLLGMATGLHDSICVQDIGLNGLTAADGLAVGRPSKFVGKTISHMLAGEFTVADEKLYQYMGALMDSEQIFIEPSACAAFEGPVKLKRSSDMEAFLARAGLAEKHPQVTHIAWATGGNMVPKEIRQEYLKKDNRKGGKQR